MAPASTLLAQLRSPLLRLRPATPSCRVCASELPCTLLAGPSMRFAQLRPGPQISCAAHCTGRALRASFALHRFAAQVSRALATAGLLLCSACPPGLFDCCLNPLPVRFQHRLHHHWRLQGLGLCIALPCLSAFAVCRVFVFCTAWIARSSAASAFYLASRNALPCSASPCHAMATSTALKAFMQAPREQRVTALRSLGAEKMVQLEGELREARLTLFGPLPASKSGKAPLASPPPAGTEPPPKQCPAQIPPPPKEEPIPAPPKDPPPHPAAPHHGMARRTANAKPRVALPIQPRTAKRLEDRMIQHRIAKSLGTGPTNKARERAASGQTFRMPTSGMISRPRTPRPAPLRQPSTPRRTQHRTQHSSQATSIWDGPPFTPMKKASPRARPSKHSTGPHPPPFPGPPPRDGPTHPQPPPGTNPRIALHRSARAAMCTPKCAGSRLGTGRNDPSFSLTQGKYAAPSNAVILLAASTGCPAINPCTALHRTTCIFCTAALNARSSKISIAQLRSASIALPQVFKPHFSAHISLLDASWPISCLCFLCLCNATWAMHRQA